MDEMYIWYEWCIKIKWRFYKFADNLEERKKWILKFPKFNDYDNEGFGLGIHSLRRAVYYSVGDIYKDMTGVFLVLSVDKHGYRFFDFKGENSRDYFNSPEEAYEDLYKNHKKINLNPHYYNADIRSGALLGVTLSVDVCLINTLKTSILF